MKKTLAIDGALNALSDTTKRAVIQQLMKQPKRAGELAAELGLSPQSLSRHLRVLRRNGLIAESGVEDDARIKVYRVEGSAFRPLRQWLDDIENYWSSQLDAFKAHVEKPARRQATRRSRR